jgi:WD40 repeat protein
VTEVDPATGQRRRVLGTFDDVVLSTALNHDETRLVAASADRSVRAYSLADRQLLWQSQLHFDWVTTAAFSSDGRFVATGSRDCTIKVLDADTGALFTTYNGHKRQFGKEAGRFEVYALAFAESAPLAFSAGKGRSIRAWEPGKAQQENGSASDMELRFSKADHTQFLPHDAQHAVFQLVVRGNELFAATGDGAIKQYDVATLKPVRDFTGHRDWVFAIDGHAASHRLASAGHDGEVRVWDTNTGTLLTTFVAAPGFTPRK